MRDCSEHELHLESHCAQQEYKQRHTMIFALVLIEMHTCTGIGAGRERIKKMMINSIKKTMSNSIKHPTCFKQPTPRAMAVLARK